MSAQKFLYFCGNYSSLLQRLLHITLALLLLIGSTGLVLSQHFCRGELKSVALFVEATPCHAKAKRTCPNHPPTPKPAQDTKGCCDTDVDFLQLDADQLAADTSTPSLQLPVLLAVLQVALDIYPTALSQRTRPHYLNYKPPLLVRDLPVSLQTFRC